MMKKCNVEITEDGLMNFAQAYLYDPAVVYGKLEESCEYRYIFGKPSSLSKYLENFCQPNVFIACVEGHSLSICCGI